MAGGAGGLGGPLVRALLERGARLGIADVDADRSRALAAELRENGSTAISMSLDVVEGASCADAVETMVRQYGRLDGIINASGVYRVAPALDLTDADWDLTMNINATGAFRLARGAGKFMVAQRAGSSRSPPYRAPLPIPTILPTQQASRRWLM